ncbi:MAG: guanylate cyclase, partial [Gammaproteobacteria bacterium]|nr:guanylate cyclase [Gammaproteobacteria bacterium]NIT64275.1 guanylate cyclase [Gammaproteobacteria bacterium]NIV21206.1 guanylate cyclase [Gammaproteobacteria bacterium]NIY32855.1 guanylate cyclase [Gammaproteobacteria bacterium]
MLNAALADRPVRELLGVEGIYQGPAGDIDFALNVSPLKAPRGGSADLAGTTLVFTDQSREKELQGQMQQVVEERRVIKDMFARYLSNEILQVLMEHPDMINPGGQKMMATVLFADIRGYTSFSEGRAPEEIIQ